MKSNTKKKSSITLPPTELSLVKGLMKTLDEKSKVAVIRRGLYLLKEQTDRAYLKKAYAIASKAVRESLKEELSELDELSDEGLE